MRMMRKAQSQKSGGITAVAAKSAGGALNIFFFFPIVFSPPTRAFGCSPPFVIYGRPKTSLRYRVAPTLWQENRRARLVLVNLPEFSLTRSFSSSLIRRLYREAEKPLTKRVLHFFSIFFFFLEFSLLISFKSEFRSIDSR